jgi:hypothetical protein
MPHYPTLLAPADLMREIEEIIVKHPESHNQLNWWTLERGYWRSRVEEIRDSLPELCRTTACVAGWAAFLAAPQGTRIAVGYNLRLPSGELRYVQHYAQHALNLDTGQASWLFAGHRTSDEVVAALRWLPDHPDATPEELAALTA